MDLGPDPRVHLLELLRTDPAGHVTERERRWINRPGIEPEVLAAGGCDEKKGRCEFEVTWAHPAKLDPKHVVLQLDGAKVWEGKDHHVPLALGKGSKPQVVTVDAEFPDGTRATYSRTLYAFYPEEAQASLVAVPVVTGPGAVSDEQEVAELRDAGLPVRTVEATDPEVTFVMAPHSFDAIPGVQRMAPTMPGSYLIPVQSPAAGAAPLGAVHVIFPDEYLSTRDSEVGRLGAIRSPGFSNFARYADAVAAAGYSLGSVPKRRVVVLVLSGFERPNISCFTAAQARAYLAEVMVPLVVWRVGVGDVSAPEWPEGPRIATKADFLTALQQVRDELGRQRVAWLEGLHDTRHLGRWLAPGIALAGREADSTTLIPPEERAALAPTLRSIGPAGGPVHALASAADSSLVYAGTHAGVFRSRDGGAHWEPASGGLPGTPVRCLEIGPESSVVFAGTDSGLFRSIDSGQTWERSEGELGAARITALALDPANPRILYAGSEGHGVLRSDDAGKTLLASNLDHGDVRALGADPRDHSVLAASERGMFRSGDRGMTWVPGRVAPARVLALAIENQSGTIVAGTAGEGVLLSRDAGASWIKTGLRHTYVTALRLDPGSPGRILAASPDGVLSSADGGANWKLARVDVVEALAVLNLGVLLAGGARGVLRREASSPSWRESSQGLTAQTVFSVAVPSLQAGALYAGTSTGLMRAPSGGPAWESVPGVPEGIAAYAIALGGANGSELLVGTSGSIGRSADHGGSWSWAPTHGAFSLSVDPSHSDAALVATREGVFRSGDGGSHWSSSASGLEKTFALELIADPKDPSVVYAATAGAGVYRSDDGARSWKPGSAELTRRIVRSLAVDAPAGRIVYAGTDSGVFRSADAGRDWSLASEGLARAPVYALLADPRSPGTIFAGTAKGLFRTTDGGASWNTLPGGVGAVVTSLWLDTTRDELVAGTYGAGVFVVRLGSVSASTAGLH